MLTISNLCFRYDARKTDGINNINLEIEKGAVISLLGPSGSGKSTLLKCIAGVIKATTGTINLKNENVVSLMNQNTELPKEKTVFEYLFKQVSHIEDDLKKENHIRTLLASLELTNEIGNMIGNLSGGQKQRVVIAKSLVNNPTLLLLDEPFANLDQNLRLQILSELLEICKERNITVIWVTHNSLEALRFTNKVCILNFGEIVSFASPQDTYLRPKNLFTARFFGESNIMSAKLVEINQTKMKIFFHQTELWIDKHENFSTPTGSDILISIRPSSVKLDAKGKYQGKVKNIQYLGEDYLISFEWNQIKLWSKIPSSKKVNMDQEVTFDFLKESVHCIGRI